MFSCRLSPKLQTRRLYAAKLFVGAIAKVCESYARHARKFNCESHFGFQPRLSAPSERNVDPQRVEDYSYLFNLIRSWDLMSNFKFNFRIA